MSFHLPVLAGVVEDLARGARRAVDATIGDGGHALVLQGLGIEILAIDRDPQAVATARARLGDRGVQYRCGSFAAPDILNCITTFVPDCIIVDLGVSSRQVDDDTRGFTFREGAPLDMRMHAGVGVSAADLLNSASREELATWLRTYGDERKARSLARRIVQTRAEHRFATSDDYIRAIRSVLGPRCGPGDLARLFQAMRIAVNDELRQLEQALPSFRDALAASGRLIAVTYHSGEDRIVKHAFREWARTCVCPPRQPVCTCRGRALGRVVVPRGQVPSVAEVAANPRARSARLRAFEVPTRA